MKSRVRPKASAAQLGYKYWFDHPTDVSFIDPSMHIGQSAISRYPIIWCRFSPFSNPHFGVLEEGRLIRSKAGGLTTCAVKITSGTPLTIQTIHMAPFDYFDISLETTRAKAIIREVDVSLAHEP